MGNEGLWGNVIFDVRREGAYRAISEIARLLHGRRTHWRSLALLQAFFDESGTHGTARTAVIAGYVATEVNWDQVQARWQEVLILHGIKKFHATDFFAQEGEFHSMEMLQRESLSVGLVEAIQLGELYTISVAVDAQVYDTVTSSQFRKVFPKPYDLCFNEIIRGIDFWSEQEAQGEEVGLVFSTSDEYDDRSQETFNNWKRYSHLKTIGGLQFNRPDKVPALQCADLLANRLYVSWDSLLMDQVGGGKVLTEPVLRDINKRGNDSRFLGEAHLQLRVANADWRDPYFPCPSDQQP